MSSRRRYRVEHVSEFRYAEPARGSVMLLRLHPGEDPTQRALSFQLDVRPAAAAVALADAFGNQCHLLNIHRPHRRARVRSRSEVEISPAPALPERIDASAWNALADPAVPLRYWEFLAPSQFARPGPALEAFVRKNELRRGEDPLGSIRALSSKLHAVFRYEPGSTAADSPIEQILTTGKGVCQDYTHVMIAICRAWGIPSRYVSGYLDPGSAPDAQSAAGASHAWAEFLLPELGWVGLDPTNGTAAGPGHIRIAVGRDYGDAAPTRGTVMGGGQSDLRVRVAVSESGNGDRGPQSGGQETARPETTPPRLAPPPEAPRRGDQ